jgi:membrane-associated phospholipid phosphatase
MLSGVEAHRTQSRLRRVTLDSRDRAGRSWARRRDPRLQAQVALATLFALALGAFLHVVEDYLDNDPIVRWDVEFSRWLHVHSNETLRTLFSAVTWAGNVAFLALVTVVVVGWLVRRGRVNEAVLVAVSAVGIELLNGGLKLLFHRPRPELAWVHLDTYSFPSGHAAGTAGIYGVVLYLVAASLRSVGARCAIALGYVVLVSVVCFSRLYLEAHYLSDVLAGASLGAAWAAGALFVYEVRRDGDIRRRMPVPLVRMLARLSR